MNLKYKLFGEHAYGIAVRPLNNSNNFDNFLNSKWITKYPDLRRWYADPFVISHGDDDYIFAELMDYHVVWGQIAVAKILKFNGGGGRDNNKINKIKIGDFKVIISEPFHMSFPNVFKYNGDYYMIPETHQPRQVRLYKCVDFPYKWELDKILLENINCVDHALYLDKNNLIMITYSKEGMNSAEILFFNIDMDTKTARPLNNISGNFSRERPGGTVFKSGDKLYRAIQDCERCYGDFLKIYEIDEISDGVLNEKLVKTLRVEDFNFDVNKKIERCHTYNQSERFEVMDFNCEKFYPNKFIMRFWQKILRKNRRGY